MPGAVDNVSIVLRRVSFGEREREAVLYGSLVASSFRYGTGIEAVRLSNARGSVIVLPYLGQIVWSAIFDGVELAMQSMFREPRPAKTIVETYGCLAYHAGLLRNGVPSPADTHILHGEMPCAEMDEAGIACGAGQVATGGGFNSGANAAVVTESSPSSDGGVNPSTTGQTPNGWHIVVHSSAATTGNIEVICASP